MIDPIVQKYFQASQSSLFCWTDHGKELCWLGGSTIAFHEEVDAVLQRLSKGCLPGFRSVILALAVTRETWPDVSGRISRLLRALQTSQIPSFADAMQKQQHLIGTWQVSSEKLTRLCRYVQNRQMDLTERVELLASLFDGLETAYSSNEQRQIAAAFSAGLPENWLAERRGDGEPLLLPGTDEEEENWRRRPPVFHRLVRDVLDLLQVAIVVSNGLHNDSDDDLQQRVQTGVAQEIAPLTESPLDKPLTAGQFLDSLQQDPKLTDFSKLTRHLLAAIRLPRGVAAAQHVHSGGIADISNKGSLDRLLLSELAFDDLTLAVRIASSEALYLQRETPPAPEQASRPVLIDNSLPLWGIPRLYATAVALTLHLNADQRMNVNCFRPDGDGLMPVPLNGRQQISDHLQHLATTQHPGRVLDEFEQVATQGSPVTEPVLITTDDVLHAPEFRLALNRTALQNLWIITVQRDGRLTILQRTRQGTAVYKTLQLPLEKILANPERVQHSRPLPGEMPAILKLAQLPLRLSHQIRKGRVFRWNDVSVSVSSDRRLMLWEDRKLGARQLLDNVPGNRRDPVFLTARNELGIHLFVPGEPSAMLRVSGKAPAFEATLNMVSGLPANIAGVWSHDDSLLIFEPLVNGRLNCTAVCEITSKVVATASHLLIDRRNGRCVLQNGRWFVVHCNGAEIQLQPLPQIYQNAVDLVEVSMGEFLILNPTGTLQDPEHEGRFQPHPTSRNVQECRLITGNKGDRHLWIKLPTQILLVDVDSGTHEPLLHFRDGPDSYEATRAMTHVQVYSPHWKFATIAFVRSDAIVLTDSQGKLFRICFDSSIIRMMPGTGYDSGQPQYPVRFTDCPSPDGRGYRLKAAELPNGTRAWLDSRGLLHLKPADAKLPEVTLVLRDRVMSGWVSTGECFGQDYHCGYSEPEKITENAGRSAPNTNKGERRWLEVTGRYAPSAASEQMMKRVTAEKVWTTVIQPLMR